MYPNRTKPNLIDFCKDYTLFRASWVYECLQSIPFNAAVATRFLDYYNTTLQFHSTLGYLKAPPTGYQRPPFDVNQALEDIKQNVTTGVYKNQYEFEARLQLLVTQLRDTHVILNAGALAAFSFVGSHGLVSASIDGKEAPQVYLDQDLYRAWNDGDGASPIAEINGVDVIDYLTRFAERNSVGYLEPHADWNSIMDSPARTIQGYLSTFQSATLYPGDDTWSDALNFTLKNGTTIDTYWWAFCIDCTDTGPLTTGGDFYNYFVLGFLPDSYQSDDPWWPIWEQNDSTPSNTSSNETLVAFCALGHPSTPNWCFESDGAYPNNPFIVQPDLSTFKGGIVSGYMFDDEGVSTAVLSIPSFYQSGNDISEFQQSIKDFIDQASQTQASRIVIDLQQNLGGLTFLAYDTFKQFFPGFNPAGASRQRSHDLSNILGEAYTGWWNKPETNHTDNWQYAASEWVITNRLNWATREFFSSWKEFYGPEADNGDEFSASQGYNLADELFDFAAFTGVPLGYDPKLKVNDTKPWDEQDIVILTDGLCASACAQFVDFMSQAGVRSVVVGGEPKTGPMQAVSGSRAAAAYSTDALDYDFGEGLSEMPVDRPDVSLKLPNRNDTGMWIQYAGFSIRHQVHENDFTPLQFMYQAADCRIYYTLDTIYNMTQLWRYTARAAWDDPSLCVEDSTGYPTARNTTTSKDPPSISPGHSQAFVFESFSTASFPDNSTFILIDGPTNVKTKSGEIVPCPANNACSSGGACSNMMIPCSGVQVPISACLPTCNPGIGPKGGCAGKNTYCEPDNNSESKALNDPGNGGSNAVISTGHCKMYQQEGAIQCPAKKS